MARKGQPPAQPVEQKPVDPAPPKQEQAPAPEPDLSPRAVEALAALLGPADVEPLTTYAARIEEAAQPLPVCQITHPEAKDGGLHVGKYAGIRLVHGDAPAALLSDGRTI